MRTTAIVFIAMFVSQCFGQTTGEKLDTELAAIRESITALSERQTEHFAAIADSLRAIQDRVTNLEDGSTIPEPVSKLREDVASLSQRIEALEEIAVPQPPAQKATITVDSSFKGYSPSYLDDDIIPTGTANTANSWASQQNANSHWIELSFEKPERLGYVIIYWALNPLSGNYQTAQRVLIQQSEDGINWITLGTLTNDGNVSVESQEFRFGPVPVTRLRLIQPSLQGWKEYNSVMWATEIEYGLIPPVRINRPPSVNAGSDVEVKLK